MLAFEKAYEEGADGIEYDVHLTRDGIPVVMHDENTLRTTGQDLLIRDLTYSEFKELDAGYIMKDRFGFLPPPSLKEVLSFCRESGLKMNIEIKNSVLEYEGIEQIVVDMLREYEMVDSTLISSFNHFSMITVKKIEPKIRVGLLEESWLVNAGKYVKTVGADDLNPYVAFLNAFTVNELRREKRGINTWTVNKEKDMLKCLKYNIDICITNYPARFVKLRNEYGEL